MPFWLVVVFSAVAALAIVWVLYLLAIAGRSRRRAFRKLASSVPELFRTPQIGSPPSLKGGKRKFEKPFGHGRMVG